MRRITVHSVMCTMDIQTTLLRLVLLHQLLTKFAIVSGFWIILEDGPLLKTQLFICFLSSYLVLLVHVYIFWYHFSDAISTPPHLPVPVYLSLGVVILSGNSKGIQQQIPPGRGAEHRRWSAACGGAGRCDADSTQLAGSRLLSAEGR